MKKLSNMLKHNLQNPPRSFFHEISDWINLIVEILTFFDLKRVI